MNWKREIKHHAQKGVAVAEEVLWWWSIWNKQKMKKSPKALPNGKGWGTALKPAHEGQSVWLGNL